MYLDYTFKPKLETRPMRLNALRTLLATAALLAGGAASAAAVGIFGSYVAIDADGPGAAGFAWYGGTQPGPTTGPASTVPTSATLPSGPPPTSRVPRC